VRREYFVYILASPSRTLYIGVTNNLERRMYEHKHKFFPGFTAKYGINRLMHIETFAHINDATAREKELKAWRRAKNIALIEAKKPRWFDLSADW
jgi:putative endonuclease